jgi:hypothetical protein
MRDIEIWEAVALTLNLEPDRLPVYLGAFDKLGDDPFRICPTPFLERLLVANSNCGISLGFKPVHELKARFLVDLPEFAAWAVKLNIPNLPPELVALAAPSEQLAPAQNTATPAPVVAETVEQRRSRRLAMFEAEEKRVKRGALQRVADSEKVDRSNMRKDIDKALAARDELKRAGFFVLSLSPKSGH